MFCNDPYVGLLKQQGYNVVRLPRADFLPLMLLAHEEGKDLSRIGLVSELLAGAELPTVQTDTIAAGISGKRTAAMHLSLGLNLLGTIVGAMGGGQVGLESSLQSTRSIVFEFPEVLSDDVSVVQLDKYLGKARIDGTAKYVSQLLDLDDLYVVTSVLKARKFTIEANSSSSGSAALDVPAIQEIVGAKVKVSAQSERHSKATFEGATPLAFGFQARRLIYAGGDYLKLEPVLAGSVGAKGVDAILGGEGRVESNMLVLPGAFTRVR
ncbi:MAG: hypothetical protein ACKVQT_35445 [Burkholderiales bacterium]